jgi:hypothetical protein
VLSGWAFELPAGSEAAMLPKLDDLKAAPPPAQ